MKSILFYCQHLLGVGHLTRSLAIASELVNDFEVSFIQGGSDIQKSIDHPNFKHIFLPPLQMQESTSELVSLTGTLESTWLERQQLLQNLIQSNQYDIFMTELFPFGRRAFKNELLPLLDFFHTQRVPITCSLRDILVEKNDSKNKSKEMLDLAQRYYTHIFVHSDPHILSLKDSFEFWQELENQTLYTGFVTETHDSAIKNSIRPIEQSALPKKDQNRRQKTILISQGGGVVGHELLDACLEVAPDFYEYEFKFSLGPNISPRHRKQLFQHAEQAKILGAKIQIFDFLPNFEQELRQSTLSISLAGYNTVMNLLNTKTYGLVLPYDANQEQRMRAERFAAKDLLQILNPNDLNRVILKQCIKSALVKATSAALDYSEIKLNGAQMTSKLLRQLL